MDKKKIVIFLFLSSLFVADSNLCLADKSAELEKGKKLFLEHCAVCHGENGEGQDPKRKAGGMDRNMVPIAPALNGTAHTWHHPPKMLFRYIDKGSIMRSSPMPSFGSRLNRKEILSIISYIQSLWPEKRRQWYLEKYKDK